MKIYLDNAASTKVSKEVLEEMKPYFSKEYGNASSLHDFGQRAKKALEKSRRIIAESINAETEDIVFTSGGTESNNFALKGVAFANKEKGNHIITSSIEHDCVINSCRWLEKQGFKITYLPVDKDGFVSPEDVEKAITKKTILVSVMHANNEVGTIEPIKEIGRVCRKNNVYFHSDACQTYTKIPIDVQEMNIDLLTINSHKIHGPKGVGALYIRKGVRIEPLMHGGGHEFKKRSGTENIPGIVGFAKAVETAKKSDITHMTKLRDYLINEIEKRISEIILNGPKGEKRLCNNVNFSYRFIEGESILMRLNEKGVMVSTGSACSSNSLEASHVLLAMGRKHEDAHGSIRMSLSRDNTLEEIKYVVNQTEKTVSDLRKMSPLWNR
ncbi:MAG: cysteine desulfurase NifS [Candidatus Nanoarchaeia archaeon]|nr:cysteine desulfurase NifS [Candidatus Nanoarchaeia archaeon]